MIERKKTKEVRIGNVMVGGDHAVTVQSMTTTKTHDVTATLKEVAVSYTHLTLPTICSV